jgi:hypothetical protein
MPLYFADRATNVTLQLYILSIDAVNEMAMVIHFFSKFTYQISS